MAKVKNKIPKFCWFCGTKLKWTNWSAMPYFDAMTGKQRFKRWLFCSEIINKHKDQPLQDSEYTLSQGCFK